MIFELERELQPEIDEEIIREYLAAFNEFKFPGPDKLHPRLLRECADVIIEQVLLTFEKLWQGEEVRDAKRQATVPIFSEAGSSVDPGDCRPVSTALVLGKSTECTVKQMIFKALERERKSLGVSMSSLKASHASLSPFPFLNGYLKG